MVKVSADELSHPNHDRLVLTVGCNLGFEDQGGGIARDFGPAATLAFFGFGSDATDVRFGSSLCKNAVLHVILAAVILALLRGIG